MFNRKRKSGDRMDSVAAEITRSAGLTDQESDAAVTSPPFLARLRARIESEESSREAAQSRAAAPTVAVGRMKLAFSGMVIVAAVAFWLIRIPAMSGAAANVGASDPAPVLSACSISATSACAISTGDVLQLLMSNNSQELPK